MDPQTPLPPVSPSTDVAQPVPTTTEQPVVAAPSPDPKQQVADKIRDGKNILVTVRTNPTVDELAAALGLTFLLGKLDKHATAVFSGKIPPAMEFLEPEGTFEPTVDSLRDFIIALDKEKADKLRYKVEDDVVKVFITPYRTTISEKDLEFSQGDFNVDVVMALGVMKQEELDKAIAAHGQILHDAVVIAINANGGASSLGSIDWSDPTASSVAEMVLALGDTFGPNLLDSQISTALLTGIVAETNRFSNDKTSPKVMTLAAQLMAAGANQQLIATNLRQEGMISEPVRSKKDQNPHEDDGELELEHGSKKPKSVKSDDQKKSPDKISDQDKSVNQPTEPTKKESNNLKESSPAAPKETEKVLSDLPTDTSVADQPSEEKAAPEPVADQPVSEAPEQAPLPAIENGGPAPRTPLEPPSFGGTLNATQTDVPPLSVPSATSPTLEHSPIEANTPDVVASARQAVESASMPAPPAAAGTPSAPEPAPTTPLPSPQDNTPGHLTLDAPSAFPPMPPTGDNGLPPLPPMPGSNMSAPGGLPPLPPLPGSQEAIQANMSPDFMQQTTNQGQSPWTQASQGVADQQAQAQADRQAKMDQRAQDYDDAAKRQRDIQGLPPLDQPPTSL